MEPYTGRLTVVLVERIQQLDDDERRAALNWLAGAKPTLVVAALEYATRLREEVEETLRS